MQIPVVRNILEANARIAADLKAFFAERGILVLNLMREVVADWLAKEAV